MEPIKFQCFQYPDLCFSRERGAYFEDGEMIATTPEQVRLVQDSDTWKAGLIVRVPRPGEAEVPQGAFGRGDLQLEVPPRPEGEQVISEHAHAEVVSSPEDSGTADEFPKSAGGGWWLLSDGQKIRGKDIAYQLQEGLNRKRGTAHADEPEIEEGLPGSEE